MDHTSSFSVEDLAALSTDALADAEATIRGLASEVSDDTPVEDIETLASTLDAIDAEKALRADAVAKRLGLMAKFAKAEVIVTDVVVEAPAVVAPAATEAPKTFTFVKRVEAPEVVSPIAPISSIAPASDEAPVLIANGVEVRSFEQFASEFNRFSTHAKTRPGKHIIASIPLRAGVSTDGSSFDSQALTATACAPAQTILGFQCPLPGQGTPVTDSFNAVTATRGEVTLQVENFDLTDYALAFADGSVCDPVAAKTCVELACGAVQTICLDWSSTCLTVARAMQRFAPETLARHLSYLAAAADQHVEQNSLAFLVAAAGAALVAPATNGYGIADLLFHTLTRWVAGQTSTLRGNSQEWRAIAPYWVRDAVRTDIAHQRNMPLGAITDAEIATFLSLTGVVNWVWSFDFQPLAVGVTNFPATATILLHNGVTRYVGEALNIGEIVDSGLALSNKVSFFSETFSALHAPCLVQAITVPVCLSGVNNISPLAPLC